MLYLSCSNNNIQQIMQLTPLAPMPETQTNQPQKAAHVAIDSQFKHYLLRDIYMVNFFLSSSLRTKNDLAGFQSQRFPVPTEVKAVISLLLECQSIAPMLLQPFKMVLSAYL